MTDDDDDVNVRSLYVVSVLCDNVMWYIYIYIYIHTPKCVYVCVFHVCRQIFK